MLTETMKQLATIEMEIRRNRAMRESCVRFNAPKEALDTLDERYIAMEWERGRLMGTLPQPNHEMVDAKQEAYRRLVGAMTS